MRATIYTFNQVSRTQLNRLPNLPLADALAIAESRCLSRCEGEKPYREEYGTKGVTFRNHTDFVEVVAFTRENGDEKTKAA